MIRQVLNKNHAVIACVACGWPQVALGEIKACPECGGGRFTTTEPYKPAEAVTAVRPWHVDIGWDGGETAIVSFTGDLIAECEPERKPDVHPEYQAGVRGEAEANARLIVEAVNAYRKGE